MKKWLRRWPALFSLLKSVYYTTLYLIERFLLGSKLHETLWKVRGFHEVARSSLNHPHRAFLIECLNRFVPVSSVLEVGCNAGPNLIRIRQAFPEATLFGIDISKRAIKAAHDVVKEEGAERIEVAVARADDLSRFGDDSIDVVFSDATLMYVGPDKISDALAEMARVARKGLVFNEWHLFQPESAGGKSYWFYSHWVHDYRSLLTDVLGSADITIQRLPSVLWGGEGWEDFGAVIVTEL